MPTISISRLDRYSTTQGTAICRHVLLRHRRTGTALLHHSLHQQASSQGQCVMNSFSRGPFLLWQAAGRKAGRQAGRRVQRTWPALHLRFRALDIQQRTPCACRHCHTQHRKQNLAQAKSTIAPVSAAAETGANIRSHCLLL